MKLVCKVNLCNRHLPTIPINRKSKSSTSTIALCQHPKSDKYCLILFSGRDKSGSKYDLKQNIENVLTKFANEGKTTIRFKNPPHDLFIQAEPIPLKAFLHLLQRILKGTISPKELTCSSLGVTAVSSKNIAPQKLIIQNRSEYPTKGFPRSLESLTITKINRLSLDLGILKLAKLTKLNLSANNIVKLPRAFSWMCSLQELDISSNSFHLSTKEDWNWIGGNLIKTLKSLNLASNELTFIPDAIIKLRNLEFLNLNENRLETLPNGIGRLVKLRELRISQNVLKDLPGSIGNLKLRIIDISHNSFRAISHELISRAPTILSTCTLKEYAAQRVLDLNLYYNSEIIPATLVKFLDEEAKYCVCGKPCFSVYFHKNTSLRLSKIANWVTSSAEQFRSHLVPVSCYFCSIGCTRVYIRTRTPLVR